MESNNQQQHQELVASKTDPLSISQLNISSSSSSPLPQVNMAEELLKSHRHSLSPNEGLPSKGIIAFI